MKLEIEYMPIAALTAYDRNAKIHTEEQIEQIADSIREFGFNDPVGISDGIIVEGHGRVMAAEKLGMNEVPVIRLDHLTDAQRRAYTLVHNQLTMSTSIDLEILAEEIERLESESFDMGRFDFDIDSINAEINEKELKHEKSKERTDFDDLNFLNTGYAIYEGVGEYEIPPILPVYELPEIKEWIGFNYVLSDDHPEGKAVHFFLDDYQFERLWNNPNKYLDKLRQYVCVASPDFSPMPHMPYITQVFNHYRKHWLGRYFQENGITVIPTIRAAAEERSFQYCFDGEPEESIIMISGQWAQAKDFRELEQYAYDEMIKRLKPKKIFLYQNSEKEWIDYGNQNIEKIRMFRQSHWSKE